MSYEINVAKYGRHFFGTAVRSCVSETEFRSVLRELSSRFPASEGYKISAARRKESFELLDLSLFLERETPQHPAIDSPENQPEASKGKSFGRSKKERMPSEAQR